jgi:hypothetical protein
MRHPHPTVSINHVYGMRMRPGSAVSVGVCVCHLLRVSGARSTMAGGKVTTGGKDAMQTGPALPRLEATERRHAAATHQGPAGTPGQAGRQRPGLADIGTRPCTPAPERTRSAP